jgi:hypothetical protein
MPAKRNTSALKSGLEERAAQRKRKRIMQRGAAIAHNCERGQLVAWFAKQPTQSLQEFKRAIEAARLSRKRRNMKIARAAYLRNREKEKQNLAQ